MKIMIPIKRVVDYNVNVRVKSDRSGVELANVKMSMNPFDEIAIEEAIKLVEAGTAEEVVLVTIGPLKAQEILRQGLAMGASRGILIETDDIIEPLAVAKILQKVVSEEAPDLVITGKQAIDDDCNQTGQMLASLLDWPQATFAFKLKFEDQEAIVTREVDGGLQTIALTLPAVVTTDLRLNEPRYVSLANLMKAKKKPVTRRHIDEFEVDTSPRLEVLETSPPAQRAAGIKVSSVAELVDKLRNEAQVL